MLGVQSEVSAVSDDLGCQVICWCWPAMFYQINAAIYQVILEHFMLPFVDKFYGDVDFLQQQDFTPVNRAKATSDWFADHGTIVGQQGKSMEYYQEEDMKHQTQHYE